MKQNNNTHTVRFMHTADWHIRDIQYGRRFRGDDFRKSILEVIDLAIYNKVDFILNGGDTLHINRPSETMLEFLFEVHQKLKEANIPMFTVTGNHDASEPSFLRFPEKNSSNPGLGGIICIDNDVVTVKGLRIAGFPAVPFGPKKEEDGSRILDLDKGTTLLERLSRMDPVDIVVWHGALEEFVPFPMRDSGSLSELPVDKAKAWLLGDIHLRARKRSESQVLFSYPGTVEMCERGEPAQKFVDIYELNEGWRDKPFPEPVELPIRTRPVIFLTVADEVEADQALSKIRQTVLDNPGCSPLIFARYAREHKSFVNRVNEIIDPRDTVFRAAPFQNAFRGQVHAGAAGTMPSLQDVVDEVVPPGSPVNELSRKLVFREAMIRHEITSWVEKTLQLSQEQTCESHA